MTTTEKLQQLADRITEQQRAYLTRRYPTVPFTDFAVVKMGKKFARVDVGSSGKYMVDLATEVIYGIKAYGVVHRGHTYGTLDTIDQWDWSEYTAQPNSNWVAPQFTAADMPLKATATKD